MPLPSLYMRISQNELDIRVPLEKTFLSIYFTYIFVRVLYEKSGSERRTIFGFSKKLRGMSVFLPYAYFDGHLEYPNEPNLHIYWEISSRDTYANLRPLQ